ncbi:MAG: hypothetical protein Q9169_000478 [Polycauliona sp. 2 TL-2023]
MPQQSVDASPPQHAGNQYHQVPFNTLPATTSQPGTQNLDPRIYNNQHGITPPLTPSPHLLSPFKFQPRTSPLPSISYTDTQQPNYKIAHPIKILHTFNLIYSIPAMTATHPMILELHQLPLDPQVQLEHELRVIAIEGWHERRQRGQLRKGELGFNPKNAGEDKESQNLWNTVQQQQEQERLGEQQLGKQRLGEQRRGQSNGTPLRQGEHGHVAGGKIVKPNFDRNTGSPRPLLGQSSPVHQAGSVAHQRPDAGVFTGLQGTFTGVNDQGVEGEVVAPDSFPANHPRPLLGQVPAATALPPAGCQVVEDVGFDAAPWEEIGRQWARIRPWELH